MGFLDSLKAKNQTIPASAMVSITETGKRSADADMERGNAFIILSELDDHSPQSVSNLARGCKIDTFRMSKEVERLRRQGKVSTNDFNDD